MSQPRPDPSLHTVNLWIRDIPELQFDGATLYCRSCKKALPWKVKSHIVNHVSSENHKMCISGTTEIDRQKNFNLDLVKVMVGCNIPWEKLENPLFRHFLEKCNSGQYGNVNVPAESTLRKSYYVPPTSNKSIFSELNEKYIWVSVTVGETTGACGMKAVNVVVGGLDGKCATRGHLIKSEVLRKTNSKNVLGVVHSSLRAVWGDECDKNGDRLLLFITDATPCMIAATRILHKSYPNMLHMTCLAMGLHSVAETIRECYPDVDKLICNVKQTFLNSPDRIRLFYEHLPNTPEPPDLSLVRCATWLQAASYHYSNFDAVKMVLQKLNAEDAIAISQAEQAFLNPNLQKDLEYIRSHFSRIFEAVHELESFAEKTDFTVVDAMTVLFDLRSYIHQLSGGIAETVKQKFVTVLKDNPGFLTMSLVVDLLNGKEVDFSARGVNAGSLEKFVYFKYAPVTLVGGESSGRK